MKAYDANRDGKITNVEALKYQGDKKRHPEKLLQLDYNHAIVKNTELRKKHKKAIDVFINDWAPKSDVEKVKKQWVSTKAALLRTKKLLTTSTIKYDLAARTISTMESNLYMSKKHLSQKEAAYAKLDTKYKRALKSTTTTRSQLEVFKMKARADMAKARNELYAIRAQLLSTEEEVKELGIKILEAEKAQEEYSENSLSQAVLNVRDVAFNTAFPNLSGLSEHQSRGFAFLTGLVLVGFIVGRID